MLAETTSPDFRSAGPWWLSPDGRAVAVEKSVPDRYPTPALIRMGFPKSIELIYLDGNTPRLQNKLPENVITTTLGWSPDGKELAFFAYDDRPVNPLVLWGHQAVAVMPEYAVSPRISLANPARLYRVSLEKGTVAQIETGEIDLGWLSAPSFSWTAAGELLFHAARRGYGATTLNNLPRTSTGLYNTLGPTPILEWLILGREGRTRPLTTGLKRLPDELKTPDGGQTFLGLSEGDVWRVNASTGLVQNVTERFTPGITNVRLLDDRALLLSVGRQQAETESEDYMLDLLSGVVEHLKKPAPHASIAAFASRNRQVTYSASDPDGSHLWRGSATVPTEKVLETNSFARAISFGEWRTIEFTSLQGETLAAALLLPPDYQPGRRYPLIVEVYSGRESDWIRRHVGRLSVAGANASWAAPGAAGYALLLPAIPPTFQNFEETYSLFMVSSAVMPAVEKAISLGIADPDRLFVTGHSWGGWTVGALLAQTSRFKAGVARDGVYESLFSGNSPLPRSLGLRYGSENSSEWAKPSAFNTTDVPWWRDLTQIRRNSVMSYADRIQTPLLLIHGDLDPIPIEQSEDLFNALVSMRKRARFVRYWGEAHVTTGRSNFHDLWQRMLAWFDDFGDIARDDLGNLIWDGERVASRKGAPALKPEDYAKFDLFQPSDAPAPSSSNGQR